ncbi:hypothetical protein DFH06DRAFT_1229867 [Mycena polygramma]|nr:hypothetical protein DFH06DRAFT_1229867 [Mycena polygramma]
MTFSGLQDYLDSVNHGSEVPLGALSPSLFRQATNSVKYSTDNNDLLEFIGDRAINLACALVVDRAKVCPDHQIFVGRKISNNDTLGRLAWWLHLDKYAALSREDAYAIQNWRPRRSRQPPPKALADLFESFVGAYCLERGWPALFSWLEPFFMPLVEIATQDFLRCHQDTIRSPCYVSSWWRSEAGTNTLETDQRILRFLRLHQSSLTSMGRVAVEALPLSTQFIFGGVEGELMNDCDRAEIAHHLISQWICNIYVSIFPEHCRATARAAHLATAITNLVLSDVCLAFIATFFSMSSYFDVEDPDFNSTRPVRWALPLDPAANARETAYRTKLSLAFQAAVGWFYFRDPQAAQEWGIRFYTSIVTEAYHTLVRDPYYRPVLPPRPKETRPQPMRPLAAVTNLPPHYPYDPHDPYFEQRPTSYAPCDPYDPCFEQRPTSWCYP